MFDLAQIMELLKVEPGHGLVQSFLLLMIWISSRGVKKEVSSMKEGLSDMKMHHEFRFEKIEERITTLEKA
jgi:hypothetical protein